MTLLEDIGIPTAATAHTDASAAIGIVRRAGLGKLRHIDCSYLFAQALNADKVVQFAKVLGQENPGDLGTKGLSAEVIARHISFVKCKFRQDQPEICAGIVRVLFRPNLERGGSEGRCFRRPAFPAPRRTDSVVEGNCLSLGRCVQ